MKSYCVKQKKQTECVPGSETYQKTKNGRTMMKCKCAECGITKSKFVKGNQSGKGWGEKVFDPRYLKLGVPIPKPLTDPKFLGSFGKAMKGKDNKGWTSLGQLFSDTLKNYGRN